MTTVRSRHDLAGLPVSAAVTTRGKELPVTATVADARRLLAHDSVEVVPLLDGTAYVGAVGRDAILEHLPAETVLGSFAARSLPTALAGTPCPEALSELDRRGGTRLVVLEDDGVTYRGLVCLRSDRERLCVDAECHAEPEPAVVDVPPSTISPDTQVAALVVEEPSRALVFERFGIDYCCGGDTPLGAACAERGVDVGTVIAALREPREAGPEDVDWSTRPVSELVRHIVEHHHAYLREELTPLGELVEKVVRAHSEAHPELSVVRATFAEIADELTEHMSTEERVVFPACLALEGDALSAGSLEAPIAAMLHEHDEVAAGLARLRSLTAGYEPPSDACNSYRAMLDRLRTLELDTHRHVHEENNVLFPRALELTAGD